MLHLDVSDPNRTLVPAMADHAWMCYNITINKYWLRIFVAYDHCDKFSSFNRHCVYFPPRPVSKKNLQRKYQQGSDKDLAANHNDTNWTVCSQFIDINTVPLSIFARFDHDNAYVGLGY